ncbi:MAG: AgmX/PglI C-terminal domain-containing protein, partial [Deltaproteobacteria bacterium]|nr:AgmX/PglI C-terminal domain-containing protein [Deltaproteobacteria bacterium]
DVDDLESGEAADPASDEGDLVAVEGILGGIPEHKVQRVMDDNEEAVLECYADALDNYDYLEGSLEMAITVDLDGSVYKAFLRGGSLGSQEAESCILGKIRRFQFPKPGGGRAEVSHSISLYPPHDPPQVLDWSGDQINQVVEAQSADVERCLGGRTGVQLTVYVEVGGRVVSAGATGDDLGAYEAGSCLAKAAAAWVFPDPGKRQTAKASISF